MRENQNSGENKGFDVTKCIKLVPKFNESEIGYQNSLQHLKKWQVD